MTTVKEIFEKIDRKIIEEPKRFSEIGAVYKFELSGPEGGTWVIDLRDETLGVRSADQQSDCTFIASDRNFVNLVRGKIKPEFAFMTGKVRFAGDLGLAMKLGEVIKSSGLTVGPEEDKHQGSGEV